MTVDYAHYKWPEIAKLKEQNCVIIVPFGATEEHGYHLPLDVDTEIVINLCRAAAEQTKKDVILPPIPFGFESHHMGFPGTIDIPATVLMSFGLAVTESLAKHGFRHILLVNGHGSNRPIVELIARQTIINYPGVLCASLSWWELHQVRQAASKVLTDAPTAHSCELETSLYLYLHKDRVDLGKAQPDAMGDRSPHFWDDLLGRRPDGFASPVQLMEYWHTRTKSGVLGDPTVATEEKGRQIFEAAVDDLVDVLNEFREKTPRKAIGPVYPDNT